MKLRTQRKVLTAVNKMNGRRSSRSPSMIKAVVEATLKCVVMVAQRLKQYTYVSQCEIIFR